MTRPVSVPPGSAGMLDRHAGSVEVTPVQVADSVVGIPVVVKLL